MHLFGLALNTVPLFGALHLKHVKLLDCAFNNIRFFPLDILINLEKLINIVCLSMLYKIFHNINYSFHCKLHQFAKLIHIIQHTAQQNDKIFTLAKS